MISDPREKNFYPDADSFSGYLNKYSQEVNRAVLNLDQDCLLKAFDMLDRVVSSGGKIFVAGNGGSAAISDHLCCDWMKGTFVPEVLKVKVQSLASNSALFTAIANDFGFESVFSKQLEMQSEPGDLAVLISSSGSSPNIIAACNYAKSKQMKVLGLCGFDGGKLLSLADVSIHVKINNYGIVEDVHQMIMHGLGQYLYKIKSKK